VTVDSEQPVDPLNATQTALVALHELFTSLVEAGFSRYEALVIIGTMLSRPQA
jgi:hypothetical protein